jgi:hypothetical protein
MVKLKFILVEAAKAFYLYALIPASLLFVIFFLAQQVWKSLSH